VAQQQVAFNVTAPKQFNEEQLRSAFREQDFPQLEVVRRP
jgi:hypothetical protein